MPLLITSTNVAVSAKRLACHYVSESCEIWYTKAQNSPGLLQYEDGTFGESCM